MTSIQYWTCLECGKDCQRKAVRGQRPKYCSPECCYKYNGHTRLQGLSYTCFGCKAVFTPRDLRDKYCTHQCAVETRPKRVAKNKAQSPRKAPRDLRSPIRRAYEEKDFESLLRAIKVDTVRSDDCWEWQRSLDEDGYPRVNIGDKKVFVHRMAVEAYLGKPLGSQQAHHTCANSSCVNPEHVIPVTASENIVEMKARHSYLARIRELEDALAEVAPDHPALGVLELY